jgi:hypothetical protein
MNRTVGVMLVLTAAGLAVCAGEATGQGVQFPPDANVRDVLAYGAVPNDGQDDTAAFQAALNDTVGGNLILYVPDGLYEFSDRLNWGGVGSGGAFTLQGQSRGGVILRLRPTSPGFGDVNNPKVFIDAYEGNTANQFRNYLQDVTIEVDPGNPGVVALQFQANNTGAIRNVTIRSRGPAREGLVGLDFAFNFPGPLLAQNMEIEGFDEALRGAPQEYSVVIENLTIRNQNVRGMGFWRLPVQIRNLVSQNSVPVLRNNENPGAWGHVVIDGGTFTGGAPGNAAVLNETGAGVVVLRNVTTSGYGLAVDDRSAAGGPVTVPGGFVSQHTTDAPLSLNASPAAILSLPIEDAPPLPDVPLAQWASVKAFGAVENDNLDDTEAVRAAMRSGARVVYFPTGLYYISDTIEIGPTVERIEGLKSQIRTNAPLSIEAKGLFRVGPGSRPVVHFNGVNQSFQSPGFLAAGGAWIEHATANTVVVRDGDISYRNSVPGGRVFFENVVGNDLVFVGQRVWARQLNPEGTGTKIINDGGDFYALGVKTEGVGTVLETRNRGRSVVMGGLVYPSTPIPDRAQPMFINNESSLSFTAPESCYITDGSYGVWVRETRDGVTTTLPRSALNPPRGHSVCGGMIALYNGWRPDASGPTPPGTPALVSTTTDSVRLSWPAAGDPESGIARYNVYRDGGFYRSAMGTELIDAGLPDGTAYSYRVSAVNGAGVESARSAPLAAGTLADTDAPRVLSVSAGLDPRVVTVVFTEPVSPATARNAANYALSGPAAVTVLSASLGSDGRTVTLTTTPMTPGAHALAVSGVSDLATSPNAIEAAPAAFPYSNASAGAGLTGRYYASREFIGAPLLTRVDPQVNFIYGTGSPAPGVVPVDNFAVRWTGQIRPRFTETYTLIARSDDGVRVFIDGVLLFDLWRDQGPTEVSGQIALDSSRTHDLVIEYYEATGGAQVEFFWQSPSQAREIVPQSHLFPTPRLVTVRTFDGAGAEITLDRVGPGSDGSGNSFGAFHSPAAGAFHSAGYVRFDLAGFDPANNRAVGGVMTLSQTFFGIGSGQRQINVFGVRNSAGGDNWIETGPGFVTWNTAAGLDQSGGQADPATAQFVDTYLLDNTNFQLNNRPDRNPVRGRLLDFINDDTDGLVTFILKRVDASNEGQSWFTKEWTSPSFAPALRLLVEPKCPGFAIQPVAATAAAGSGVTITAAPRGAPTLTLRWLRNGAALTDGPQPSGAEVIGAQTAALTILNAQPADAGDYALRATNTCGTATSQTAALVVTGGCPGAGAGACGPGDWNEDGVIDFNDLLAFLNDYNALTPCSDVNGDGAVDFNDLLEFLNRYNAGC